ncbi:MAG: metal ABC transporter permease [Ruminococcaceae bacterium]|nr:metal ABC transporter permease [Oscillospiraceae bacterium]
MKDFLSTIFEYFSYPFVAYSFIVGILIAFSSSLFGASLVLKRHSMIGDGLSHIAFGAMAVSAILNFTGNDMIIVMPVTVLSAIIILRTGKKSKIKGDASIAMLSVGSLAVGYLLMNVFPVSTNISGDVCSSLFGSTAFLNLKNSDVFLCSLFSIVVILLFVLNYNKIFAVTFDEDFFQSCGVSAERVNLFMSVITAVVIVLAMNLVGALLISALIVFPPISAMRVCKSYFSTVITSAIISVISAAVGIILSMYIESPVGSTVAVVNIVMFFICSIFGQIRTKNA